jgi:sulfonate transport system substrate-binding protein
MKSSRCIAPVAALSLSLLAPALPWSGSTALAQQPETLVRIASARGTNYVALWGIGPFAKKYGLRIELIPAINNADLQRAVVSGGADLAALGYQNPAVMAEQNATNVKIISGIYLGGQNLIMRKGVELPTWKGLEGKKIGVAPGTFAQVLFILAAQANNVDVSKINTVNVTAVGTGELQALKNGDLDGLVLFSPTIDRGVVEGYAYYPPCCDISSTATFDGRNQILGANTDFLKNRQTVVTFLKAYVEAANYYAQNRDKAVEVISQFTGIGKDVVDEALKHAKLEYRVDVPTAVAIAKEGPKFGFTRADMSDKVPSYFDLSYLSEATGKPIDQLSSFRQ